MGINLKDLGNIATGMYERDKELTRENLAIRHEELKANRDFLVAQKQKKYDRQVENYYKEKEKFDTINQANEMYNKKAIDARTYAATILPLTNPNWKNLDEKTKQSNIASFDGQTINYKLIGSEEEIQKQAAEMNAKINSVTAEEIKNAKGDSFLIKKILGDKAKAEKDLLAEVESKIKAADSIKMSEQSVNQEYVGKDVKVSGSGLYGNIDKTSTIYSNFANKNYDQLKDITSLNSKVTSKDNNEAIKATFKILGVTNSNVYFSENKSTGEITGFKKGGESFGNTIYNNYKQYQDFLKKDGTDYLYVKFNGDIGELPSYYGKQNLNGTIANRTFNYGVPVANNAILGEGGKLDFKTVLRNEDNLIVVPTGNTINFDDTVFGTKKVLNDEEKKLAGEIYAKTLMNISSEKVNDKLELNPLLLKQNQARLENLPYGNTNSELLNKVNLNFGISLVKEGLLSKEQFLSNNVFNYFYKNDEKVKELINTKQSSIVTDKVDKNNNGFKIPGTITIITKDGTVINNVEDTDANRNNAIKQGDKIQENKTQEIKEQGIQQQSGDGSVAENIYGVNKNIPTKKEPTELGDTTFKNLESVLKLLPKPMTGQEIKDNYNIDFPINLKSTFVPLK